MAIRVHDSNADMRYMVLSMRPQGTEDMTEEQLVDLVTRDFLIGVTMPRALRATTSGRAVWEG
jgi:hypothetical protein